MSSDSSDSLPTRCTMVYEPIDGLLGIATVEKNRHREWFYWCDHTPVINSPIYDDTLARFYYIDAETGKMRYRGIHGDREVSIPAPGDKRYGGGIISAECSFMACCS